jgi:hypothetical protein
MRRPLGLIAPILVMCGAVPVTALALFGELHVMPPMWVHFYGVGVSALAATVLAAAVTWYGARHRDVRTVVVGDGTRLTFVHSGLPSPETTASHAHGWDNYLPRLALAAEGGDPGRDPFLDSM